MLVLFLTLFSAQALECPQRVSPAEIDASLSQAEQALMDLDDDAFRDQLNQLSGLLLPCAAEVPSAEQAARIHRTMAVRRFSVGDTKGALAAAQEAHQLDPSHSFAPLLPDSHELAAAWASAEPVASTKVPEVRSGSTSFDGVNGRQRPAGVPTLFQLLDASGLPTTTVYLGAGDPLPPYTAIPRRRNALLGCAGGAAVLSGTSYGLAWASRSALFDAGADPTTPQNALTTQRRKVNMFALASSFAFGAAAGCGVGAGLVGAR